MLGRDSDRNELTRIVIQCCVAVLTLQKINIIHRDIAARNFLLTEHKDVKLSDFGMAKQSKSGSYYSQNETAVPIRYPNTLLFCFLFLFFNLLIKKKNNFRWCSPEVLLKEKFSLASDRYSVGITMFEIWSKGIVPFVTLTNKVICFL
jgi:serine/threonine protein kinase